MTFRRGACPALSAPMPTGDGLLVRLALTGEALRPGQLQALCAAATQHGNGMVEITARGNFQIRGLTDQSAPRLADKIAAMHLGLRDGVPVETGPLAGVDLSEIADSRPLANAIRAAIDATDLATRLSPKTSIVIDGGGHFDLSKIAADVRITAVAEGETAHWLIAIGGDESTATELGIVASVTDAEATTLSLLEAIASHGPAARMRDLATAEMKSLVAPFTGRGCRQAGEGQYHPSTPPLIRPFGAPSPCERGEGFPLTDGRFAISAALPFGSIHAADLSALAGNAATLGVAEFRFAPDRALILICASQASANAVCDAAGNAGLITAPADPRRHVFACPGNPACASGNIAARDIAAVVAHEWADLINGSCNVHISGCSKGCAHPARSAITLLGNGNRTALVVDGSARNAPAASVPTADLAPALSRLAEAMRTEKHDTQRLAAAFAGD